MKSPAPFDASIYECGPATEAVRRLLSDYAAIDWFVPPTIDDARARALMHRHHTLGRACAPDLFAAHLEVEHAHGGVRDLFAWCERVRKHAPRGWDWKYGVLKPLTRRHSEARGWRLPTEGPLVGAPSTPGRLFTVIPTLTESIPIWNVPLPRVGIRSATEQGAEDEALHFYKGYCDIDLFEALEWQLAEPECPLSENPFVPLLELYATAHYPFHLSADRVVLFRFDAPL
ncbi:MAG: hypothetical protein MUE69_20060 [Myxococcota bacterium]|jgi:hypothetical protein|nr:hypothetical protein [Myxococcota bacterium]